MTSRPQRHTILITGASSGLGEGMARRWAAKGHALALCARRIDLLEKLREELLEAYPDITVQVRALDVVDPDAVRTAFTELDGELGGIDRFVLNAGLGKGAAIGSGKAQANVETAVVNALGTLHQAEAALELLRPRNAGHLVFISSVAARRGMPKAQSTYAASKAFISTLAEGIHAELSSAGSKITVTTIRPGYIDTAINRAVKTTLKADFDTGCDALVAAIEAEPVAADVPRWPWVPISAAMAHLPEPLSRRLI